MYPSKSAKFFVIQVHKASQISCLFLSLTCFQSSDWSFVMEIIFTRQNSTDFQTLKVSTQFNCVVVNICKSFCVLSSALYHFLSLCDSKADNIISYMLKFLFTQITLQPLHLFLLTFSDTEDRQNNCWHTHTHSVSILNNFFSITDVVMQIKGMN